MTWKQIFISHDSETLHVHDPDDPLEETEDMTIPIDEDSQQTILDRFIRYLREKNPIDETEN